MREKERESEREEERASARKRDGGRKRGATPVDDSGGLGNRIVIIVYTSVFYELSVALSFGESVVGGVAKRRGEAPVSVVCAVPRDRTT